LNLQEDKDLTNNVGISARRFEESPFLERQDTAEMVRGVYANRFLAVYNGEDSIEKYWVLRTRAAMFDVPEKPIEISGPDVVPFLEKVLTRRVSTMQLGRGYYALACTPQGGIFMDGVVFKLDDQKFWYVQADGPFETWLIAHSGNFDIKIRDPKSRVLQIQGPASFDIMHAASQGQIDETMAYFRSGYFDLGGQPLFVSRTGFTNELGFEIYTDGYKTDHLKLWDHLIDSGKPFGMEVSSTRALTIRRIEGGILGNLTDMDITMTPYEAGLGPFVNLDKGDFIGREALIGRDQRPLLLGLTCRTAIPSSGSEILYREKVVGHITAGVPSPTLGIGVGYARFNKPDDWIGRNLQIKLPDTSIHICEVVELPFFDKEKAIVKGKDRTIPKRNWATLPT
jgi:aminomethyltransferase